jgi:hypoxanthine phosphoribosyltransferase
MNISGNISYTDIKIQRKTTKRKERKIIRKILQIMPQFITNWLRMLESEILRIKIKFGEPQRVGNIEFEDRIDNILLKRGCKNILIVDDAIDSGTTLKLIYSYIKTNYSVNVIKVAVITVTNNKPIIDADYYLYHNRTLVRFPWSNDV